MVDKILFIVPPNMDFDSFTKPSFNERTVVKKSGAYGSVVAEMPIGLLSLSAFLKAHTAADIKIIDFNVVLNTMESFAYSSFADLFHDILANKEWLDYAPSIIGISTLFTPSYHNMMALAGVARHMFASALIIAGGGVPTNMYSEIFETSTSFDALCYGEGEKPLLGLVQAIDRKKFLKTHPSWITREKVENKQSFQHDFIGDLDEIPFLPYDMLNPDDYRLSSLLSLFPLMEQRIAMPIMTSRGCPHRCCFCSSHTVHGRKMRYHSLGRVREDLKRLQEQYHAETIVFFDDHFMADKQRVFDIINTMKVLKLTAFFPSSLALYTLDRKTLEALKSIGVNHLILSVESGSDRVLKKIMHKPLDLSIVSRVIADCRQLGIASDLSILIGLPGETKQDIEDARSFLKTLNATWFRISMATPLIGSEMLDICKKHNYLKGDYLGCNFKRAVVETEDFTAEFIQEKAYSLNLELNFLNNSDFRLGNYETALKGFENTIKVKSDHAFAFYFAAKCCKKLNLDEKYQSYNAKYHGIIKNSEFWKNYAHQFDLAVLE
ncbi:MAG: radical SAM protein [Kiritimatiellaeota bacterium]|nr:radical SAM protein [Kiritimatiellota bacterium]